MSDYLEKLRRFNKSKQYQEELKIIFGRLENWTNARVLDYGCGRGEMAAYARDKGHTVVAVDKSMYFDFDLHGIDYMSIEDFDKKVHKFQFDFIVMMNVIGHIPNPKQVVPTLLKLLSPTGRIILCIPSKSWKVLHSIKNWFTGYKDDPTLYKVWSVKELEVFLDEFGFVRESLEHVGESFLGVYESHVMVFK